LLLGLLDLGLNEIMLDLNLCFYTPVWKKQLSFDNQKIAETCFQIEKNKPSNNRSNVGGYQIEVNWDENEDFTNCKSLICETLGEIITTCFSEIKDLTLGNCWININRAGDYNTLHYHPGSFLSGCLYIQAEENSGDIVFERPDLAEHYMIDLKDSFFSMSSSYTPVNGLLLIFPSWIPHHVTASVSNKPRVSFAFNVLKGN
jgi:uncharacterized protein (TIGR02466 family)